VTGPPAWEPKRASRPPGGTVCLRRAADDNEVSATRPRKVQPARRMRRKWLRTLGVGRPERGMVAGAGEGVKHGGGAAG